jgi:predicted ferric reductase
MIGAPSPPKAMAARASTSTRGAAWVGAYLALVAFPLLALLVGRTPPGLGFWWDLAIAFGFSALAVTGAQFALTARFRRAGAPFGLDVLYYFHRWMAVAGVLLLMGHWAVFRVAAPEALTPWQPWEAPGYMTAGRLALLLFVVITASSFLRKALGLEYDRWRVLHAGLAVTAVVLALWHVAGAGYYTAGAARRGLLVAYAGGWLALVLYIRLYRPWRLRRLPWRVAGVHPERGRSWTLTLEPVGHPGLGHAPGQFAWLTLRSSPFAAREHPFSIASSALPGTPLELTIRELGDFTSTVGETRVGETAWVDGPYGAFTVDRHARASSFLFVAGGVGIAPIMGMLRTLVDRGERRPLHLVYGNDRWEDVLFREEIDALARRLDLHVTHVLRDAHPAWAGERGLVTKDVLARALPEVPRGMVCFLCGPRPMTEAAERALQELGVPRRRIHVELFDMV